MLTEILELAEHLRPGYTASLGRPDVKALAGFFSVAQQAPDFIRDIYSLVHGTPYDVAEQRLMDFVPGYRLIAVDELVKEFRAVNRPSLSQKSPLFPFLANYSGDYICWDNGQVVLVTHDGPGPEQLHASTDKFLETVREFYLEGVYVTDADGYLDYDYDREREVGTRCNPGVSYWAV